MAPSVVQLAAIWFLPESPRWLISKDRDDEALDALRQYHGEGEETELVKLEYEEIRAAIDNEKSKNDYMPFFDGCSYSFVHRAWQHYLEVYGQDKGQPISNVLGHV